MVSVFALMGENWPSSCIDDILLTKGSTFKEHLYLLKTFLKLLMDSGMQVNTKKSNFCQKVLEFLGCVQASAESCERNHANQTVS